MLAGLTDDFKPLVMAVENSKEKLTVDMVKNVLLQDAKFDKAFEKESASQSKGVKKAVNGDEHTHITMDCNNDRWLYTRSCTPKVEISFAFLRSCNHSSQLH
ncbi:uncharacterized protein LOC106087133 [Stomoxys calcitrans]|uniref:uncharacterized protein LOC106087133 n=1 Tax=Stomoxys calcitrans TaxID=35570 RepID=UPI0027E3B1C6|nr:uncharacterized protein LOC106087133 [Stomoxys calcitrans]